MRDVADDWSQPNHKFVSVVVQKSDENVALFVVAFDFLNYVPKTIQAGHHFWRNVS